MRVEVLLERSSNVIVHDDVVSAGPNDSKTGTKIGFRDGSLILYPYRNYSWLKASPDSFDEEE